MAFSVSSGSLNPVFSNDISCLDGKKSLFLLRKIVNLTELGYKNLNNKELSNTAGDVIDIYLRLPHQHSDSIKKELQGLELVRPHLANYSFKRVSHAALSELTGINQSDLAKTKKIHLNQIYAEQLLTWMQEEIEDLPSAFFILPLLKIYHSFSDPSIGLDTSTWQELLSVKEWNASQKTALHQFRSKYESLHFCSLKIPFIKIENTTDLAEATGDIERLKNLYSLWMISAVTFVRSYLPEGPFAFLLKRDDDFFVKKIKEASDKEFITHAKTMVDGFVSKFDLAREGYNKKIAKISISLKNIQEGLEKETDELQDIEKKIAIDLQKHFEEARFFEESSKGIQEIQKAKSELENCLQLVQDTERVNEHSLEKERKEILCLLETKEQELQAIFQLQEKFIKKKQDEIDFKTAGTPTKQKINLLKKNEEDQHKHHNNLTLRQQNLASILFLSQWLFNLLEKEDQLINQLEQKKVIAYEASIKKGTDSFFEKHSTQSSKKKHSTQSSKKSAVACASLVQTHSIPSENTREEEEEPSISSFSTSSSSVLEKTDSFNEITRYLIRLKEGKSTQLNGFLNQAVDSFLKPLKAHLLAIKAADNLNDLCKLQTKEIYDHLLLGTAGLELVMQAVHDQRTDHIALGFRAALLHCYYAMEQKLSQRTLLETNKVLDKVDQDHNLLHLAQEAKIADIKKWERFLQEMTLHLTLSYPKDYWLFFQQGNEQKAFSLLDDLSNPNLDKKKIEEALEFCFDMYSKSLAFITEVSSAQIEDQPKLLSVIQELKKQIISTLHGSSAEKILLAQVSVMQLKEPDPVLVRVQKCLSVLHPVLKDLGRLSSYVGKREQKIYAAIGTIESYLKLMGISLEIPQNSSHHSLQRFIKVETIVNVDKLFKHLFRAVILLENGEDNHQHTLINLFTSVADFYQKDDGQAILSHFKDVNLGISHHYLHTRKNHSKLYLFYKESLAQAYSLLNVSDEYIVFNKKSHKKIKKSAEGFQKNIDTINELVRRSLDLFIEFLEPTLEEIRKRLPITAIA
ncbi:MAG TPA: hypothetical protein VGZ69_04715 [Candidatus Rhabdochlamydia sp.]|nr:hypothetical protein [Candidatus Rhabdochlamydia sp.]